ncbi:hypothetical protein [Prosthecobacter sp.]|uniref:hypothetical protein n=1 Tax=Prosthecobacter sp. TaxID=1965333 RepID=UPI00378430B7
MNDDEKSVLSATRPVRWKRLVWGGVLLLFCYAGSYAVNTWGGGYWDRLERDGKDRYGFGLSMPTALLWQPRFGYWTPFSSDAIGLFFSPLIRLDRRFVHGTHYATDAGFEAWMNSRAVDEWHPLFRGRLLEMRGRNGGDDGGNEVK